MANNDSIGKTLLVAVLLCIACSLVVSSAAVLLKPAQVKNKSLDLKKNILAAAGLLEEGVPVEEQFERVETRVIDLETGRYTDAVDAGQYDARKAAKDPALSMDLSAEQDLAKINRRVKYQKVYLVKAQGEVDKIILPVHGYGLWSTLYGFIALEADANTVAGLGFYDHAETPGLGGEVDNPKWKAQWPGKKVYQDGDVELALAKGRVDTSKPEARYKVDGLAGATLTSRGITNLLHFWLGEMGYKPYLKRLREGGV